MSTDQQKHEAFEETGGAYPPVSPFSCGLRSRCPRCAGGRLFDGYLTVAERCTSCDLDYSELDSGDGPAVFVILVVGFIVTFAALYVEVKYQPSYWVHAALWLPAVIIGTGVLLRVFKATLIAIQFRTGAREGRLHDPEDD